MSDRDIFKDGHGFINVSQGGPRKTKVGVIDLTPTWESVAGIIEAALVDGNAEGRAMARTELLRMAKLADLYVASQKGETDGET